MDNKVIYILFDKESKFVNSLISSAARKDRIFIDNTLYYS